MAVSGDLIPLPYSMASGSNMDIEGATQHLRDILKLDRPGNSAGKLFGRGREQLGRGAMMLRSAGFQREQPDYSRSKTRNSAIYVL